MKIGACGGCGAPTQRCLPCPHCGEVTLCAKPSGAALILGLAVIAGCTSGDGDTGGTGDETFCEPTTGDQADYGTASVADEDDDGYGVDVDCDDEDADVHPGAKETADDGLDSNCNCVDDE
jgi:hypothetical protein